MAKKKEIKKVITKSNKAATPSKEVASDKMIAPKKIPPPQLRTIKPVELKSGKKLTAEGWLRIFKKLNP